MKRLATVLISVALGFVLYGCAPGAISPAPVYEGDSLATGPYPSSTRAGHFDEDGFYVSAGPVGLGLEVAQDAWRGVLYASYSGAAARASWSEDAYGVSLDVAYNAYTSWQYVDTDDDGYPDTSLDVELRTMGMALDATYYFDVPTDIGSAYVGPRGRFYFACESENGGPYACDRYGLLPGGTLGINVPIKAFSDRLTLGFEGSVFVVIPGITDRPVFSIFSPFALNVSYRF